MTKLLPGLKRQEYGEESGKRINPYLSENITQKLDELCEKMFKSSAISLAIELLHLVCSHGYSLKGPQLEDMAERISIAVDDSPDSWSKLVVISARLSTLADNLRDEAEELRQINEFL